MYNTKILTIVSMVSIVFIIPISEAYAATYKDSKYVCDPNYMRDDNDPGYSTSKGCTDRPFKGLRREDCGKTFYRCSGDDSCPGDLKTTEIENGMPLSDSQTAVNSIKDVTRSITGWFGKKRDPLGTKEYAKHCSVETPIIPPKKHPTNELQKRQSIKLGQYICSTKKKYKLKFQKDGNLCFYQASDTNNGEKFIWCNMKHNFGQNPNSTLIMQDDGNLVIYKDGNNNPVWATNTNGSGAYYMQVVDTAGSVMVSDGQRNIWSAGKGDESINYTFKDC